MVSSGGKGEEGALGSPLACPPLEWRAQGQSVVLLLSPAQHEWTPPPPGHSQPRGVSYVYLSLNPFNSGMHFYYEFRV
ncbi:hypothetical protein E2C01_025602 [Portunus trituberculatus]|uniref:Uncharacterized protein n=1 Tax=Portunus trituberculatus TaxID=210409 RepID=A0A5B7EDT0_PORTR|nr:hypothetical protein [Portunus trituberculatus]